MSGGAEQVAPVTARAAATLICVRDSDAGLEVLTTVRHTALTFGSGALVFPGGRVEAGDHEIAAVPSLLDPDPAAPETLASRVAAIREAFEESGVLLARDAGGDPVTDARLQALIGTYRAQLCAGTLPFREFLDRERLVLNTGSLVHFAHWITPQARPKRFDTQFFLAPAPVGQVAGHDAGEAVSTEWLRPADAIAGGESGRYKLLFPTRMNLLKLGRWRSFAEAAQAARSGEVVTVLPEMIRGADGARQLRIPLAADYGGELFPVIDPPAM